MEEALRLFEGTPPSRDHAEALFRYWSLQRGAGRHEAGLDSLLRGLRVAEASGSTTVAARCLAGLAWHHLHDGKIDDAFALLERGWQLVDRTKDLVEVAWLAVSESDALLKLARLDDAATVGLANLEILAQGGRKDSWGSVILASNAAEALLGLARTDDAGRLVDPLTTAQARRDDWLLHLERAQLDLL